MKKGLYLMPLLLLALVLAFPAAASHQPDPDPSPELQVVGQYPVLVDDLTSDVWAYGNYAYIGSYISVLCSLDWTGVRVIDISDPANPSLATFIPAPPGTRNNDVKVEHIETPHFTGEILVVSNEPCSPFIPRLNSAGFTFIPSQSGIHIWDVTDPTRPRSLKRNYLNFPVHNTFIWQQGSNAYLMVVDDVNARDVHIVDITKPQSPREIAVTGWPDWPALNYSEIAGPAVFLHDMWVQENANGRVIAYLAYWDAGLVLLDVTDPYNPVYLGDSTYPDPDVVSGQPPDGDGHVAVPTEDGQLVLFGDEDISKGRAELVTNVGTFPAGLPSFGASAASFPAGDIVWTGGLGCSSSDIPPADMADPDPQIALIERGVCFFSTKAYHAELQGYDAFILFNHSAGGDTVLSPVGAGEPVTIPGVFIGHSSGLALQAPGTRALSLDIIFTGEGFMRVLDVSDPANIVQLGHFATEGVFSLGWIDGWRTAHNVMVRDGVAYWAWYEEGMRVVDFSSCLPGGGFESCTPVEIAHFVDDGTGPHTLRDHSDFWGVYLHDHPDGNTYILGSDLDSGLWIFALP